MTNVSRGRQPSRTKKSGSKSPALGGSLRTQKHRQTSGTRNSLERTSPLRNKITIDSRSRSPHERNYDLPRHRVEGSPLRNRSGSPFIDEPPLIRPQKIVTGSNSSIQLSHQYTRSEILDIKCREKIETLMIDNDSIRRRLAIAEEEYKRTMHDKHGQYDRLAQLKEDQDRLQQQINQDGSIDISNHQARDSLDGEKRHNDMIRGQIEDLNLQRAQAEKSIIGVISDQKALDIEQQRINTQIGHVLQKLDQLHSQKMGIIQRIQEVDRMMENARVDELTANHDKISIETAIEKMRTERNALMRDLENDTREYNLCVSDISRQKQNLDHSNIRQQKFIVAKIIFNNLNMIQQNRKQEAIKEFAKYNHFNHRFQSRMRSFIFVMIRLARYRQGVALDKWYNNTLKPFDTINQNESVAFQVYKRRYLSKVFFGWKQYYDKKINEYKSKTDSIEHIWERLCQNRKLELKRCVDIWKGTIVNHQLKKLKVKKLLFGARNRLVMQALVTWKNVSMIVEEGCRIHMLKLEYSQKFYLTSLFNAFKMQIQLEKRIRLRQQDLALKSWKDHLAYNRHMMQMNMSAIQFSNANKTYMIKVCFDAFKVHKENKKSEIMQQALSSDMDVALEAHDNFNKRVKTKMVRSAKKQSGKTVRNMLGKRLFAYFDHWKKHTFGFKSQMNTKIKDRVFMMYRGYMLSYFNHWRKNATQKKIRHRKKMIMEAQEQSSTLEKESIMEKHNEASKSEAVRSSQQKKSNKMFKKFYLRVLQNAINRWKEKMALFKQGFSQNNNILNKMRKRFLKDAFERYKAFYRKEIQLEKNEKSADYLIDTINRRTLRRHYNAFCAYTNMHRQAKRYWKKIFAKVEVWILKNAIRKWQVNSHKRAIEMMTEAQHKNHKILEERNHKIGKDEMLKEEQEKKLEEMKKDLQRKGHKQLGNYLMRYYMDNTTRRFRLWKELTQKQRQKEKLLKNAIDHMRKAQFAAVRNAFKNFITQEKVAMKKRRRVKVMQEQHEMEQIMKHNEEVMEQTRQKAKAVQVQSKQKQGLHQGKLNKAIGSLTRRNQELVFSSKKRMIFTTWYHCVKQQKAFLLCVNNVLSKSMSNKGFFYIKNHAREYQKNKMQYRHLNRLILKFKKNNVGDFFSRWKNGNNRKVDEKFNIAKESNEETIEVYTANIERIKNQNTQNVEHFIKKRWMKKLWTQWLRVKHETKIRNMQNQEAQQALAGVTFKNALQKWFFRVETTKRIRRNLKLMKDQHSLRFKRSIWEALLCRRAIKVDLAISLSNIEKFFREKNFQDSFRAIKSYSNSKKLVKANFQRKTAIDIASILTQQNEQRLRKYFGRYSKIVKTKSNNSTHVKKIINKLYVANLRDGFFRWKKYTEKENLVEEMNQTGPITEQVFEANRSIRNLTSFMRDQNYTEEEITAKLKHVNDHNEFLMHKIVKRLKTKREDRQVNRCFDHWVFWLKVRKLFQYHLAKANFAQLPVKCDLHWAFHKWKKSDSEMATWLNRRSFEQLCDMNSKQCFALDRLADTEAETSTTIHHLTVQRDELLDHYVRSQKLAMARLIDIQKSAKMQAIDIWKQYQKAHRESQGEGMVADAVTQIQEVKKRMQELEKENATLATENEQLRKFSLDGFQIAKNVQQLANERESLSSDLADKSNIIQQLLEENQKLKDELVKRGVDETDGLQNPLQRQETTKDFLGIKNH